MTDKVFILLLKPMFKDYFQNNRSVGLEILELVEQFRKEAHKDFIRNNRKKRRLTNESKLKNRS